VKKEMKTVEIRDLKCTLNIYTFSSDRRDMQNIGAGIVKTNTKIRNQCLNTRQVAKLISASIILLLLFVAGCNMPESKDRTKASQTISEEQIQDQMLPQNWMGVYLDIEPEQIINEINMIRTSSGLQALERDEQADLWAQVKAAELVFEFSHDRLDGGDMITAYAGLLPPTYGQGIARGHRDAILLVYEWLELPWQKENIYEESYSNIGCAVLENNNTLYFAVVYLEEPKS